VPLLENLKSRAIALKRDTLAIWYASRDKRTPWYARLLVVVVAAYALSPLDLIPDFIPILGYLDDLVLIPAGIALTLHLIPPEVMAAARARAADTLAKPNPWWMTLLIILVWLGVLALLLHLLLPLLQNNGKIESTF
jgi:uncharacterized membrane protein YkvA (DUF1232 family)